MEAIRKGKKLALVRSCEGGIERGRRERERDRTENQSHSG